MDTSGSVGLEITLQKHMPPKRQKKGFKNCKQCNGYGFLFLIRENSSSVIDCFMCKGKGQYDWIDKVLRGKPK